MEACPKLPMLAFDHRVSPSNAGFADSIRQLIRDRYREDPNNFKGEISELESLRASSCIRPTMDTAGTDLVKKYYCQLHFIKNRFDVKDGMFNFQWYEDRVIVSNYTDLGFEMAAVLYNLGALHSNLGTKEIRSSSEEMKIACTHFQCAAWAFHELPDRHPNQLDVSTEFLAFLSQVCLAQGQECILEKSILDHRKSTIIAKVCVQVAEYYRAARVALEASKARQDTDMFMESGDKRSKLYEKYIEFKKIYYFAVAYLYLGVQADESQRMGERVTYFQAAKDNLAHAVKLSKNLGDGISVREVAATLEFTSDVISAKLDNAIKENEFVFHEKVPELSSLEEPKGASLVKGIGFDVANPEVSGTDLFAKLVPMGAHEAASLYSEEQAKLIRGIGGEIELKDDQLVEFLSALELDEIPAPSAHLSLPQDLIECAAGLSVKGEGQGLEGGSAVERLADAMARIASVSADVEAALKEIKELLENEAQEEAACEPLVGKRPNPLNSELEAEMKKLEEAHLMASESNIALHKAISVHMDNLKLLSRPLEDLQREVPSMADLDDKSEQNIAEVRRLLDKVEEMRAQRAQLSDQLRMEVHADDITKKLIAHQEKEDFQEIFDEELKKFEPKLKLIRQNLLAQDNILRALTEANANFAETRQVVAELLTAREVQVDQLIASYHSYDDLLVKAAKGLEFYSKLDENVGKLLDRTKGVVEVQQEERDARLAARVPDQTVMPTFRSSDHPSIPPLAPGANPGPYFSLSSMAQAVPDPANTPMAPPVLLDKGSPQQQQPQQRLTLKQVLDQKKELQRRQQEQQTPPPASAPAPAGHPASGNHLGGTAPYGTGSVSQGVGGAQYPNASQSMVPSVPQYQTLTSHTHQKQQQHIGPAGGIPMSPAGLQYPTEELNQVPQGIASQPFMRQQPPNSKEDMAGPDGGGQRPPAPVTSTFSGQPVSTGPQYGQNSQEVRPQYQAVSQAMPSASQQPLPLQHSHQQPGAQYATLRQIPPAQYQQPVAMTSAHHQIPNVPQGVPSTQQQHPMASQLYGLNQSRPRSGAPLHNHPLPVQSQHFPELVRQHVRPQYLPAASQGVPNTSQAPPQFPAGQHAIGAQQARPPTHPASPSHQPQIQGGVPLQQPPQTMMTTPRVNSSGFNLAPVNSGMQQPNFQQQMTRLSQSNQPQQPARLVYPQQPYGVQVAPQMQAPGPQQLGMSQPMQQTLRQNLQQQNMESRQHQIPQQSQPQHQIPQQGQPQHQIPQQRQSKHQIPPQGQPQHQVPQQSQSEQHIAQSLRMPPLTSQLPQMYHASPVPQTQMRQPYQSASSVAQYATRDVGPQYTNASQLAMMARQQQYQPGMPLAQGGVQFPPMSPSQARPHQQVPQVPQYPLVPQPQHRVPQPQQPLAPNVGQFTPQVVPNAFPQTTIQTQRQSSQEQQPQQMQPQYQTGAMQQPQQQQQQQHLYQPHQYQQQMSPQPQVQRQQKEEVKSNGNLTVPEPSPERRRSSVDILLEPDQSAAKQPEVLHPKVLTAHDLEEQKKEAKASEDIVQASVRDPYESEETRQKLLQEFCILESKLTDFSKDKTSLDGLWKEMNELTREDPQYGSTISVARCYMVKNRQPDVCPFDKTRVSLPTTKDDYINASHVRDLSEHSPRFIATQAPTAKTLNDFWTMVAQEQVETLLCLLSEKDMDFVYWPEDRKSPLRCGPLEVTLQGVNPREGWTERTLTVRQNGLSRVTIILQLNDYSVETLTQVVAKASEYHTQQRALAHPLLVHCLAGSGRTALALILAAAMAEVNVGKAIPDLVYIAAQLCKQRKGVLKEREHLRQAYQCLSLHCRQILARFGLVEPSKSGNSTSNSLAATDAALSQQQQVLERSMQEVSLAGNSLDSAATSFFSAGSNNSPEIDLSSLADKFSLGLPKPAPTSKQDFSNPSGGLKSREPDPGDPLSQLDPLWTLK